MDRRKILASAGMIAAAGVLVNVARAQEQVASSKIPMHLDKMHAACLEACQQCSTMCNETVNHCMGRLAQGEKEHATCAAIAMACQEFCNLSAQLIARSSTLSITACEACAKACDACAAECEKIKSDEHMVRCATVCRECAKSCRTMR